MGWTYTTKFSRETVTEFFQSHVLGSKFEVLDSALKNLRTWYAAVRTKETGEVWAAVFLVDLKPHQGFNIGYKDMDETVGPCERECPERIMKLLTPLSENYKGYALQWRDDCWANIEKRKSKPKVKDGMTVKFEKPIKFTDGYTGDTFVLVKYGRQTLFRDYVTCTLYRISKWRDREFEIV